MRSVQITATCWLWTGCRNRDGYGVTYTPKRLRGKMARNMLAQVQEIRARISGRNKSMLAREYGVSPTTICNVASGRKWGKLIDITTEW